MAKKKNENTLKYLQMPLPSGGKYSKMTKVAFGGLNKRYTIDSGDLTIESNISTSEYPYLTPSNAYKDALDGMKYKSEDGSKIPISMFAFDDFMVVIYRESKSIKIDYITATGDIYTGVIKVFKSDEDETSEDNIPRSIVQFNVYIQSDDIVNGSYKKHLLIFPDKKSMFFELEDLLNDENNDTGNDFKLYDMSVDIKEYENDEDPFFPPDTASHKYYYLNTSEEAAKSEKTNYGTGVFVWEEDDTNSENTGWKIKIPPNMPNIKYATVHLSRLFGVSDDCIYASGFNDYTNWNLDTVDEYNESNAWQSKAQSNTKADGNFTGIINYQGHVVCFKRDYMHEIYNTKNPFRIQDIYAEGAIDNRTLQDVDGKLIFVSEDDVKVYTGSNPRVIGYNLNMPQYYYAVSGTDNRNYYLYCEDNDGNMHLYVYDTFTELWSEQAIEHPVLSFAHNKNGMYMLCDDGVVYKLDTNRYNHQWSFETDLITNRTVDIKHIKKLQMLVEHEESTEDKPVYMKVYILYDDESFEKMLSGEKEKRLVYDTNERNRCGKYPIRVKPRKTANYGFKLHVEGYGYVKLYELEIFVESGGDLYV